MERPVYFRYGKKEKEWLAGQDRVLGEAINRIGHIRREVTPDLFSALINSIVGQQISSRAHATVWARMREGIDPLEPLTINALSAEELQSYGISMRKALYIKGIAEAVVEGRLDLPGLAKLPDEEVCKTLVQLKGIGIWTAEMLMIFSMQRKNILSWGDLAIQRGMRILYKRKTITPKLFEKYRTLYSPYASVASLYLWDISKEKPEA
ncbi:MAG: DNA-3-methyladenine glycosylase 2 family protein [Treponema sp.]|nr:DNA-3-methyladenine glycosylase 2 family protein [Treponema sp.]